LIKERQRIKRGIFLFVTRKYYFRRYHMAKAGSKKDIERRKITFALETSDAKKVILMGDFNNWNPKKHPMKKDGNGMWTKTVMLFPGEYEYKFLVDGEWKEDPQNDQKCLNRFGTLNNIFKLPS
jgi:1,4-alpha-glucan branching enzyme